MVDFGGWEMPVQYSGILEEHQAVRRAVGLFDVSHMGEVEIRGREAGRLVDFVSTNHAQKLKDGQVQYSGLLYAHGGFVDDILVHRVDAESRSEILHIRHHSLYAPRDFDISPFFAVVKPTIETGFDYKTMTWDNGQTESN